MINYKLVLIIAETIAIYLSALSNKKSAFSTTKS
jgi:hypothetical protein